MSKYKITKPYLKEFFGLFGKPKETRSEKLNRIIANDPVLKKLDSDFSKVSKSLDDRVKNDPELLAIFKKLGVDI